MNSRSTSFRNVIEAFIDARRQTRLKDENDTQASARYGYDAWLQDAARRVLQIKSVTHVLKATHPDARGSNLHVAPAQLLARDEVGSHALGGDYDTDVVGNAAALDVYKLLKLPFEGRRLLDWLEEDDADLLAALSPDVSVAQAHAAAFRSLMLQEGPAASHTQAKQLYWCTGPDATDDSHYHLLQPMFPSSLVHAVHATVKASLSGKDNTAVRRARKTDKPHDGVETEYRGLAIRKQGGTKPQNISQLTSERGGINYLLASLPPIWKQEPANRFLSAENAIERIEYFGDMRALLHGYLAHIRSYDQRTMANEERRRKYESELGLQLAVFGRSIAESLPAGWTRGDYMLQSLDEMLWLDPERAALPIRDATTEPEGYADDLAFNGAFARQDWPDEIARRYAEWVSGWLRKRGIPMGDSELRVLAREAIIEEVDWPNPLRRDLPSQRSWYQQEVHDA